MQFQNNLMAISHLSTPRLSLPEFPPEFTAMPRQPADVRGLPIDVSRQNKLKEIIQMEFKKINVGRTKGRHPVNADDLSLKHKARNFLSVLW